MSDSPLALTWVDGRAPVPGTMIACTVQPWGRCRWAWQVRTTFACPQILDCDAATDELAAKVAAEKAARRLGRTLLRAATKGRVVPIAAGKGPAE